MAAPHVTGAFALLRQAYPNASVDDIEEAMEHTGRTPNMRNAAEGDSPRIQVDEALDYLGSRLPALKQVVTSGPLVSNKGAAAGGADASIVQDTTLGMGDLGSDAQQRDGMRVADDFVISEAVRLAAVDVYGLQTGSDTDSTLYGLTVRIWDGEPGQVGSSVVWGDDATNRMRQSGFSDVYRKVESSAAEYPIMRNRAWCDASLNPGTYWLDVSFGGYLASDILAPPIAISGQTTTGNALQYTGGSWQPLLDSGSSTQQGLPFTLYTASSGLPFLNSLLFDSDD